MEKVQKYLSCFKELDDLRGPKDSPITYATPAGGSGVATAPVLGLTDTGWAPMPISHMALPESALPRRSND
jgi:hypothetical protein